MALEGRRRPRADRAGSRTHLLPAAVRGRRGGLDPLGRCRRSHACLLKSVRAGQPKGSFRQMTQTKKKGLSRRALLKSSAAALGLAAGSGAITGFPTIWAKTNITLRQFGTGVSNHQRDRRQVQGGPRHHARDDGDGLRRRRAARGDPAGQLRHRRHRILDLQEGVPGRRHAADGYHQADLLRQDRAAVHHRQADARIR